MRAMCAVAVLLASLCAGTSQAADASQYAKEGFVVQMEDGRLWIFKEGCKHHADFKKHGELAKFVVRPRGGPDNLTVKAPDYETIDSYMFAKKGFAIRMEDGRIWVFKAGSKEIGEFDTHGELAKHVVRPGRGPGGKTIKAPDGETIDAYMAAK